MSKIKHWMMSMDQAIDEALFFDLKGDVKGHVCAGGAGVPKDYGCLE